MLMHVLDPGRRMGTALGMAGEIPRSGFVELRQPKEDRAVGEWNLTCYLLDVWRHRKPDLLVYEEPLSIPAWHESNKRKPFPTNSEGVASGLELQAIIRSICRGNGVRCETVRRQTVLKFVTGTSRHGSREAGKKAVIEACIRMNLVEPGCRDDDRCDAVANFAYVSAQFAKKPIGNFQLFA